MLWVGVYQFSHFYGIVVCAISMVNVTWKLRHVNCFHDTMEYLMTEDGSPNWEDLKDISTMDTMPWFPHQQENLENESAFSSQGESQGIYYQNTRKVWEFFTKYWNCPGFLDMLFCDFWSQKFVVECIFVFQRVVTFVNKMSKKYWNWKNIY